MRRRSFLVSTSGAAAYQLTQGLLTSALGPWNGSLPDFKKVIAEAVHFDLNAIPFSCAGSFLSSEIAADEKGRRVRFTTNRRSAATYRYQAGAWSHELFEVELLQNRSAVAYKVQACATRLVLTGLDCKAHIQFLDPERLQITVRGAELAIRFSRPFAWKDLRGKEQIRSFDNASGYSFVCCAVAPSALTYVPAANDAKYSQRGDSVLLSGVGKGSVQVTFSVEREESNTLLIPRSPAEPSYETWMQACPIDPNPTTERATRIAWYLFWASRVSPSGGYTRRAVLSSRRSLSMIWSWDNLFNAMTLAPADWELAWDQLLVVMDHQLPTGVLPDVVSEVGPTYGFRKPPLWAWTVQQLLADTPADRHEALLHAIYPKIVAYHQWWFRERDLRGDGVPVYLSGNDSGWDNASIFADGWPVQSPDLLALLCLDAECLSEIATRVGRRYEAEEWQERSERLLKLLHRHFVRDDRFVVCVLRPDGAVERSSTSLLTRIPILLGERLALKLCATLVRDLRDEEQFSAPSGPASESLQSSFYSANGYWRGPVWGPSTLLICEGLWRCKEKDLARDFARRYRGTCARKADFRENYDARTGEGRYDTGMTWSASDYLLLGRLLQRD